jgi:16S rRNA (guanine527-N7)-methyltransferase
LCVSHALESVQRMNLTAVTDEAEVMTRHVADSLAVLPPLERAYRARSTTGGGDTDGVRLIDVGSGAGLPGLILAVARPSKHLPLIVDNKWWR